MLFYIIQICVLALVSIFLIYYYSHSSTPYYVRFLVFFSFYVCMLCFIMLPIDVYQTSVQSPNQQIIIDVWIIIYYINFFTCWLILPLAQQYQDSGHFTPIRKIKQALTLNGIMIAVLIVGAIVIAVLMILRGGFTLSDIPSAFATLVNIFGLTLVSIFLGFGLASFPKQCFQKRDYKKRVDKCHREAQAKKYEEQQILQEIYNIRNVLNRKNDLQNTLQIGQLLNLLEQCFPLSSFKSYADPNPKLQGHSLDKLHKIVKKRALQYHACESTLDELVDQLKSVTQSYSHNNYFRKRWLYTVLFAVTVLISALIFLAELSTFLTFLWPINLLGLVPWESPASYVLNLFLMSYIAYIVTHTVFRIKLYKVFALHRKHSTASSMLFTAINLARVCYPLCYNYLQITGMTQNKNAFIHFFGNVNIPNSYAVVFPILMIVFALFNLFDVYDKVAGYLGLGSFAFDDEQQIEKKQQGRNILMERLRERNTKENTLELMQLL